MTAPASSTRSAPESTGFSVGDRVWVTLAGDVRPASGTAQEYTVVRAERAFALPGTADFDLGAEHRHSSRHRAPRADSGRRRPDPAAPGRSRRPKRAGRRRRGSGRQRGDPARPLGGRDGDRHGQRGREGAARDGCRRAPCRQLPGRRRRRAIRRVASDGVDLIVEVAAGSERGTRPGRPPAARDDLDLRERRRRPVQPGRPAQHGAQRPLPVRSAVHGRLGADRRSRRGHHQAIEDGALRVGERAGLPLHRFALEDTAAAHAPSRTERSGRCSSRSLPRVRRNQKPEQKKDLQIHAFSEAADGIRTLDLLHGKQ